MTPDAGKPQIHDKAPPQWTGVPVERDPISGKLLSGDPLGRGDKGRSVRTPGRTALIGGVAGTAVAAVAVTAFLVTRDDRDPDPAASVGTVQTSDGDLPTSEQNTSSEPGTTGTTTAAETGPRNVTVTFTTTKVTPPPGFPPDAEGSVGDVLTFTWTVTGPCDGTGPCELEQCDGGVCGSFGQGEPQGSGYVTRFSDAVTWGVPECTGGTTDNTITWAVTGDGEDIAVTGSWVQQAAQVVFTGSDGRGCGIYLNEWSIAS
jgi:hypothetical protein